MQRRVVLDVDGTDVGALFEAESDGFNAALAGGECQRSTARVIAFVDLDIPGKAEVRRSHLPVDARDVQRRVAQ